MSIDFQDLYQQYSAEKAYEKQFERYTTLDDLMEAVDLFQIDHNCNQQQALVALYLADFVVTSSNIKDLSISDEKRRLSLLQFCLPAWEQELDTAAIIALHMLSQELGVAVRRNFVYQLDRGLPVNIAIIRLADIFVVPFLKFSLTVSEKLTLPWLIALADGAISEILSSEAYEQLKEKKHLEDLKDFKLTDAALGSLERFIKTRTEKPNPHAKVPALSESVGAVLIRNLRRNEEFFGYSKPMPDKQLKKLHKEFSEVCAQSKFQNKIIEPVYYRATSLASTVQQLTRQVFLVRGKPLDYDYEAWFFLNTTVDDINLETIRKILEERCVALEGVIRRPLAPIKRIKKKRKTAPISTPKGKQPSPTAKKPKPSFWQRILAVFSRKKPDLIEEDDKAKAVEPESIIKEEIAEPPEIEMEIDEWNRNEVLNYWAETLVVDAVANIDLEEIYDTLREKNWIITGLADFSEEKGTLLAIEEQEGFLKSILTDLSGHFRELRDVAEELLPQAAKDAQMRFIPQEIFLEHKGEDKLYDLFTFGASDEALTVLMAQHSHLTTLAYIKPNKEISKRRTLQMRTRQLATARTSFPIEDRMISVLEPLIDTSALKKYPISAQFVHDLQTQGKQ
ncbi:MAG: hypothetical protein ACE5OZ_19425 [Candidatus Heimdallarchaeota archaeon]